jgi:hypothetical protein
VGSSAGNSMSDRGGPGTGQIAPLGEAPAFAPERQLPTAWTTYRGWWCSGVDPVSWTPDGLGLSARARRTARCRELVRSIHRSPS